MEIGSSMPELAYRETLTCSQYRKKLGGNTIVSGSGSDDVNPKQGLLQKDAVAVSPNLF